MNKLRSEPPQCVNEVSFNGIFMLLLPAKKSLVQVEAWLNVNAKTLLLFKNVKVRHHQICNIFATM